MDNAWLCCSSQCDACRGYVWQGGFYVANRVGKIVESATCFVLLNPFDDRASGLSNVVIVTVLAGNLIDSVYNYGVRFRSKSLVGV